MRKVCKFVGKEVKGSVVFFVVVDFVVELMELLVVLREVDGGWIL